MASQFLFRSSRGAGREACGFPSASRSAIGAVVLAGSAGMLMFGMAPSHAFLAARTPHSYPSLAPGPSGGQLVNADFSNNFVGLSGADSSAGNRLGIAVFAAAAGLALAAVRGPQSVARRGQRSSSQGRSIVSASLPTSMFNSARKSPSQVHLRQAGFISLLSPSLRRTTLHAKKSLTELSDAELSGKTVLVRCDLNVPIDENGSITDETRITASIPTLDFLVARGAKCLLCSHLGRPKKGPEERFSLKPVAKRLGELMGKNVRLAPDCQASDEVKDMVATMCNGDVIVLENTRFHAGEEKNDVRLAESMASLADLYVNDAFGTAHRAHASTEGVARFLSPNVAGLLLKKELDYLDAAISTPKRPLVAIVGGAKVSTKIPVIESLLEKVDKLVIGGGMVFTFLKARGLSVGTSLVEEEFVDLAKKLEQIAAQKGVELILPTDIVCGDKFPTGGKEVAVKIVPADAIPDGWMGLDNGPETTARIVKTLSQAQTVIWNGPMGVFESAQFCKGTYDVAECLADLTSEKGLTSIVGGGDSVAAVNKAGLADRISHISTGGGACLELLEGKVLPGVAALDDVDEVLD